MRFELLLIHTVLYTRTFFMKVFFDSFCNSLYPLEWICPHYCYLPILILLICYFPTQPQALGHHKSCLFSTIFIHRSCIRTNHFNSFNMNLRKFTSCKIEIQHSQRKFLKNSRTSVYFIRVATFSIHHPVLFGLHSWLHYFLFDTPVKRSQCCSLFLKFCCRCRNSIDRHCASILSHR